MRIACFDCPSGASGDMMLASLVDSGLEVGELRKALDSLSLPPFRLHSSRQIRSGIAGTGITFEVEDPASARHLSDIEEMIGASSLPAAVRERSIGIFRLLGEAEAKVHDMDIEKVHFHEVGAMDSILDIVGSVAALDLLGISEVYSSVPSTGTGRVKTDHGSMPVPVPATVEILKGRPFRPTDVEAELLTPTGAALLVGLTGRFGPPPPFRIESVGYGAGAREHEGVPNMLRVTIGEVEESLASEEIVLLETDVDDVPAELLGGLFDRALEAGALDLTILPAVMKKNRPGHRISIVARPADAQRFVAFLVAETGTLGVRVIATRRHVVEREVESRETSLGPVRYKKAVLPGGGARLTPEYDDCLALARRHGLPLREVWEIALREGGPRP